MEILLNGEPRNVDDGISVSQLLELLELTGKRIAVEINQDIVPRSHYGERAVCAGDKIEIVRAIGGG